ncbi:apolipoprotein N-acyltransferase [Massilia violaceinigra]|uniref:Apolipoprotein N-acyltransferase n=1 Tax=Massilia violaceinigra TaxID=2045208 RepID=A0ABY4A4F6_9BURK|nr:apolipoprotein N-acyltransferase [Massilia violaceinigra]UOD29627.1 apolipoprotein N-acyltransferase [Massilia violaceinigra]
MHISTNATVRTAGGILASGLMVALYARGGAAWLLGFVLLAPWLRTLDASPSLGAALLRGWLMSVAYTAAAFAWFGSALGLYAQVGAATGVALLLLAAPLFQPQFLVFALVRHLTLRRHGAVLGALAGAAAWVASQRLAPGLLGDTLGHGLYPSRLLRQGADLGGTAGLTFLLLLANEGVAAALARRADGWRAAVRPLAAAALAPLLLAGYGLMVLSASPGPAAKPLRVGLIQSNIVAYDRQRQERGTHAVVREILDTHFAMSYDAVVRQRADAVLWPETAYPTTFGNPKSEAGADFDREILAIVNAAGVPFVFGTYDRDSAGEYNAAAFVQPGTGLMGFYRKTHLFPLTETVPAWLDGPRLRRALPWTGDWRAGNGARVFPLRLADGREIPVLPLICLDDVVPAMAIDGARLGAQAILTMSNDSWFSASPLGARMHQTAAAFRSIETRLPQFRATTNGFSAVIDAHGSVLAGTRMGERTLVIAAVPLRSPAPTLMVLWGDWVGLAAGAFLVLLAAWSALPAWRPHAAHAPAAVSGMLAPAQVAVLTPAARLVAGLLRACARAGLLWMCVALLLDDALRTNTLAQMRMFAAVFLAPEAAAWCMLFIFSARASIANGHLVLQSDARRLAIALGDIATVQCWRLPLPCPGISLRLAGGQRYALALSDPGMLAAHLAAAAGPAMQERTPARAAMQAYAQASLAIRRSRLDHPAARFVLLPLALAIPAFHLHQHISYGGPFGEYYSFGLRAYLTAFALWWAAWTIGVVLSGALLRSAIESATLLAAWLRPARAADIRQRLERGGHVALFVGLPAWLLLTIFRA